MDITWVWTLIFCAVSALVGIHIGISTSVLDKIAELKDKLGDKVQPYWYKDHSELKKVKEELEKERKLKHSLEVSIDLICKRHKEECSSLKQELKKVKKECDESATVTIPVEDYHKLINPDDIDWDELGKHYGYEVADHLREYLKTKAGRE